MVVPEKMAEETRVSSQGKWQGVRALARFLLRGPPARAGWWEGEAGAGRLRAGVWKHLWKESGWMKHPTGIQ